MAITALEYRLLRELKEAEFLPPKPAVIEFGEANWYGDVPVARLAKDIEIYVREQALREALVGELREHAEKINSGNYRDELFHIAKIFYRVFLDYERIFAVDLEGTKAALRHDLNQPLELEAPFDVALNFGTGEHIFDTCQFFRNVHEATREGGVMMHGMPFQGWVDHGFYTFQPTLYWDLAAANGYVLSALLYCELDPPKMVQIEAREDMVDMLEQGKVARNAMLYAVLLKGSERAPFRVPMQGYYARTISQRAREAWETLR